MGRPKKEDTAKKIDEAVENEEVIENSVEEVIDVKKLIEEALLKQQKEFDKKFKKLESENAELEKKAIEIKPKKKSTLIPKDVEVVVKSNIDGKFGYSIDKGGVNFSLELSDYDDDDTITMKELKSLNSKTKFLKNGRIAIMDVLGSEYTVEDVLRSVHLVKLYNHDEKATPNELNELFSDEVNYREFARKIDNSTEIASTILEVAMILYKSGELKDRQKIDFIKQKFRKHKDLFN